jgi:hypothetical protein
MRAQQVQMVELLSAHGWEVRQREAGQIWYRDEVWTIESSWQPVGQRAYLSFIVDPRAPSERSQGEHVWAVEMSRERPYQQGVSATEIPIRRGWEKTHRPSS